MAQVLSRILGLGTVNRENIQKTTQGYLVNIHYQNIGYTFLYVPNTMSVENILLSAEELPTIRIVDTLPLGNFRTMLSTSADYVDRVRDIYANNNALSSEFVNISIGRNEIVIGTSKFPIYD